MPHISLTYLCPLMFLAFPGHALEIFACAIAQLASAHAADISVLDNDSFFQGLWGACLYYQARSMSEALLQQAIDRLSAACKLADSVPASVESLATITPVKPTTELELLGQSYILLSTLAEDDEEALEAFDKGIEHLKRALEMDPGGYNLLK
ncbi:hypothetical protein BC937DRAFT_90213 [Endogone sp. FLAS-F59071]|nr:hypothetical protein BC937DRAFT_90213 [Endogone sp. FLAS-F59071]|eukprot:RUS17254.1 hypothetical protein BC937DRAFT_90213 [Endogone sp. FLAS-F59071]